MGYAIESLAIRGQRDEPVPNHFFRQETQADHLAVLLPGYGYTCDMPTLYFTTSHLLDHGADVLQVDYTYSRHPEYGALAESERHRWLLDDVAAAWEAARGQRDYRRLTFVGKSLGTRALPHLLAALPPGQEAHAIWLTPLLREALSVMRCYTLRIRRSSSSASPTPPTIPPCSRSSGCPRVSGRWSSLGLIMAWNCPAMWPGRSKHSRR